MPGRRGRIRPLATKLMVKAAASTRMDMVKEPARTDGTGLDSSNEVVSLDAGEFLFREGDAADALYIVRKGTLRVVSGSTVYETLKPGGIVGEDGYCRSISPSQCLGDRRHAC